MQQEICPRGRVGLCAVTYNKRRHVSHFRRRCIECARFFSDAFKPTTNYVKNTNNPKKQWFASHSHLYSSTVNNSTVPITSWPLMSANSSLTAHYVREVKGTCGNWTLFTSIWPCECRQLDVPAFLRIAGLLEKRLQWHFVLTTSDFSFRVAQDMNLSHGTSFRPPCAYVVRLKLK